MDILKLIDAKELISFSQNFSVTRNYLGDRLFPDMKTQHMKSEFYRLSDSLNLPTMALVHALDTETNIGERPTAEKVELEKMLIKEKINQSEHVQLFLENGGSSADQDAILQFVFDDVARLSESVKTRTEVMKCQLLQTGKVTVKENNVDMVVDYGVPNTNKFNIDVSAVTTDVMGAIQDLIDKANNMGEHITEVVTSGKTLTAIRRNEAIQAAIYGTVGKGTFVSAQRLNEFMQAEFGITISTYDERYRYKNGKNIVTKRYLDEDKMIALSKMPNNTIGTGLWGPTPEELSAGHWTAKSSNQYITSVMWNTPDPVATWAKSSGMFIPVLPNKNGLFIGTVKFQ